MRFKGELEHKTPKKRFPRANGKEYVKQMTGLERREARIRRIREKLWPKGVKPADEPSSQASDAHHHIGTSQSNPVHIGKFLQDNAGDPAIKVRSKLHGQSLPQLLTTPPQGFWSKLKKNLLPRILDQLKAAPGLDASGLPTTLEECDAERDIVFKEPRIYQHQILHINYTSYDVRRLQDIVNARSSHNNIMVLTNDDQDTSPHFRYGRVLGTYHVKAIYIGPGFQNRNSQRFEFLWVRWYDQVGHVSTGWQHRRLDRLRFAPINDDDAFGIIDPSIVLRGCHIIPRFALGPKYLGPLQGLSHLANDSTDWKEYYVNRYDCYNFAHPSQILILWFYYSFVDRDMVMRYHFGLGVGHVYSHGSLSMHLSTPQDTTASHIDTPMTGSTGASDHHFPNHVRSGSVADPGDIDSGDTDSDFEDSESESSSSSSCSSTGDDSGDDPDGDLGDDDLQELAAEEMYHNA